MLEKYTINEVVSKKMGKQKQGQRMENQTNMQGYCAKMLCKRRRQAQTEC